MRWKSLLLVATAGTGLVLAAEPNGRDWTLADSIGVKYFAETGAGEISYSPDRQYVAAMVRHGELDCDCNVYELKVWRTDDIQSWLSASKAEPLAPYRTVSVRTTDTEPGIGIGELSWDSSSRALYYLGNTGSEPAQVHRFDLQTGEGVQVTHVDRDVSGFIADGGTVVAYTSTPAHPLSAPDYPAHFMEFRDGESTAKGVVTRNLTLVRAQRAVYATRAGGPDAVLFSNFGEELIPGSLVSPSGRFAALVRKHGTLLTLVDTRDGSHKSLSAASESGDPQVSTQSPGWRTSALSWSADSRWFVFASVTGGTGPKQMRLDAYDTVSGRMHPLGPMPAGADAVKSGGFRWTSSSAFVFGAKTEQTFTLPAADSTPTVALPAPREPKFVLSIRESANQPPELIATAGKRTKVLLAPNRETLRGVQLAQQRPFQWSEGGQTVTGGLYLPRNYRPGHPVPLVVQAYFYHPDRFLPDGGDSTASAAQLLTSRGFAVLKYDIPSPAHLGLFDPQVYIHEMPRAAERFEAATQALIKAGIADPERIGLTGFSRAGWQASYLVTHPGRTRIAAAIAADSFVGSVSVYETELAFSGRPKSTGTSGIPRLLELVYGAERSLADGWEHWARENPEFNVARSQTPFLQTINDSYNNGVDPLGFWGYGEMYLARIGTYVRSGRPIEHVYFKDADHNLQRPRQREAMFNIVVDWMAFWLNGTSPADPDRARRWTRMKDDWQRQQAWEAAGNPAGSTPNTDFSVPAPVTQQ